MRSQMQMTATLHESQRNAVEKIGGGEEKDLLAKDKET